jgi:hypothetical protein
MPIYITERQYTPIYITERHALTYNNTYLYTREGDTFTHITERGAAKADAEDRDREARRV